MNARPQNALARSLTDVFGWSRPFRRDILPPTLFELALAAGVLDETAAGDEPLFRSLVRAASLGDMLFLHSAFPTDTADAVFFGPDTYRFANAITAHLAERTTPVRRAVDIGCGAGAGGLLIGSIHPDAEILLTDINETALAAARLNAHTAAMPHARFVRADVLDAVQGDWDLVVANPPYLVDAAERRYRHGGGPLGAALSLRIARDAMPRLAPGGSLLLYTASAIVGGRDLLREALFALPRGAGCRLHYREADPDVFGEELRAPPYDQVDRIAAVVFTVARPL